MKEKAMSVFTARRGRALLGASALSAGLLANGLVAPRHAAAYGFCRSDPIVVLDNGAVLDLSATINADISAIKQIRYTLHAPAGTSVVRVISTDGPVDYKEKFNFQADGAPGAYGAETRVDLVKGGGDGSKDGAPAVSYTVTATIQAAYASQLGVTPAEVGIGAFTPSSNGGGSGNNQGSNQGDNQGNDKAKAKGPQAPSSLPSTVTADLNAWAMSAAWSVTATASGQSQAVLTPSVSL